MYKIADNTKDNTTIIPVTENFEPVEVVTQPVAKNLLNFKTLSASQGVTVDRENLTLTTDGSATLYQCDWSDSASVCEKHLSHSVTVKCHVKILEDCTVSQDAPFRISVFNETKNRTLSLAGLNSVAAGTVYTASQEFDWVHTTQKTANYDSGDIVKLYVYAPSELKAEFSNIMISLENILYEPYPDCEVIFVPDEIESEGTDIAVNNTYNDTLEAKFYGKSELKFDVAECQGNTTQEVHERDSYNILDLSDAAVNISRSELSFELQEDGGWHVWGTTTGGETNWNQLSFTKSFVIPAGTYYTCGKNARPVMIQDARYAAPNWKLYSIRANGTATVLEEDIPVNRVFFQWGGGVEVDEVVYAFIGTQFVEEYEPYYKKTPTPLNPSPIHADYEGGINVLQTGNVSVTSGLSYELQADGGYHITGSTASTWAQIIFTTNIAIKAGTYFGCAQNTKPVTLICHDENGNNKYMSVKNDGSALTIEEDTIFTRAYVQWPGNGNEIDEVAYPFVGTQFTAEYIPFNSDRGKYQINHARKKYEIQLPCDLHGFAWDDIEYRNVLQVDFLHKRFNLRKKVGSYVVPATVAFSTAVWPAQKRAIFAPSPAKATGNKTIGNCTFATVSEVLSTANKDIISPYTSDSLIHFSPDLSALGISDDTTIEEANELLQDALSKLSAEERTVTYALAEEIVLCGDIVEVEDSTLPELPLSAIEITEQSFDCPAVIEPVEGIITVEGKNLIDEGAIVSLYQCKKDSNGLFTSNMRNGTAGFCSIIFNPSEHLKKSIVNGSPITFSIKKISGREGTRTTIVIWGSKSNKGYQESFGTQETVTIVPDGFTSVDRLELRFNRKNGENDDTESVYANPMLTYGSEAVDYVPPFLSVSAALPALCGIEQLDSATEYDYIDADGKKIVSDYIEKKREKIDGAFVDKVYKTEKIVLNTYVGRENWLKTPNGVTYPPGVYLPGQTRAIQMQYSKANYMCTHIVCGAQTGAYDSVRVFPLQTDLRIYGFDEDMTVDDWKAMLASWYEAGAPFQVMYQRAEPVVTDITDTPEGQAILALKTIPYHTRIYSNANYYIKAKMRVWEGGEEA